MKILVIGGGAISGGTHIPQSIKFVGVDNVILADPSQMQRERQIAEHGLKHTVADYHDALGEADICIIATPPHIRNMILKDCIAAGKHIFAEKPLTPDTKITKEILSPITGSGASSNLIIGMCHTYRFFNNRKLVRQMLKDGFFGAAPKISVYEGSPSGWPTVSGYCFRKEMVPGGVLYDNGIHSLDFVYWCLGMPASVQYSDDAMGGLESNCEMTFAFDNGASAYLRFSRTMKLSDTIVVEGNGHKFVMEVFEHNNYVLDGKPAVAPGERVGWDNIATIQMQNFMDAVAGKTAISCPVEDGLHVIEMLEMCYAQKKVNPVEKKPLGGLAGKRVFITGGTGFIGSQMVEQLILHEDAKVRVLVHTWAKAAYVSRFDVEFVQADLLDKDQMIEATKDCDYIIHAAIPGGNGHDAFVANNIKATENIMAAAKANHIASVVQLSSVVVHGETVPEDLTADSPLVSYGETYADGKLASEKRFWELLKEHNLHGSIVRPTYVWGPYSMWYTLFPMEQMRKGEFAWVDKGRGMCNAVYVGNVVDLCLTCLTNPKADGEAFIAADAAVGNWYEFFSPLMEMMGMNPKSFPSIPLKDGAWRTFRLAWKKHLWSVNAQLVKKIDAEEMAGNAKKAKLLYRLPRKLLRQVRNIVTYRLPVMAPAQMAIYNQHKAIDVRKNKEVLGFEPRYTVKQGQEITKQWLSWSDLYKA